MYRSNVCSILCLHLVDWVQSCILKLLWVLPCCKKIAQTCFFQQVSQRKAGLELTYHILQFTIKLQELTTQKKLENTIYKLQYKKCLNMKTKNLQIIKNYLNHNIKHCMHSISILHSKNFKKKLGLLHNLLALQNCDALLSIIQIRKVQGITPCVLSSCCDWYCPALSR